MPRVTHRVRRCMPAVRGVPINQQADRDDPEQDKTDDSHGRS